MSRAHVAVAQKIDEGRERVPESGYHLQLRIVSSNPLGVFNPGEAIIVLCEIYHNGKLFCRFERLSSQWYVSSSKLKNIPRTSRLRLTFLNPINLNSVATSAAFENHGTVDVPLFVDSRWVEGYHCVALTKDYEDIAPSGWVQVCSQDTQDRWVRAYMVMKNSVLKWQATESGGDNLGVAQWHFIYLDKNLIIDFPSQFTQRTTLNGTFDIRLHGKAAPVLSVAALVDRSETEQVLNDSRNIVRSILETTHLYPSGMLLRNFPSLMANGDNEQRIHFGTSRDAITRSIGIQLQAISADEVSGAKLAVRTTTEKYAILEGSVNVLQFIRHNRKMTTQEWPAADSSRLVQAFLVLYEDYLVWYKERDKQTELGRLALREFNVRRATREEESPVVITTLGNVRRETFNRSCFTMVEEARVAANRFEGSGKRHFKQQRWVFDVSPSIFQMPILPEHDDPNGGNGTVAVSNTGVHPSTINRDNGGSKSGHRANGTTTGNRPTKYGVRNIPDKHDHNQSQVHSGPNGSRYMTPPSYKLANNSFLMSSTSADQVRVQWIDAISTCAVAVKGEAHTNAVRSPSGNLGFVLKVDALQNLTQQEKNEILAQRFAIRHNPHLLRRFLQATNWQKAAQSKSAEAVLESFHEYLDDVESETEEEEEDLLLNVIQSLDATLTDQAPYDFVVDYIANYGFRRKYTGRFLAQLVQALKLCHETSGSCDVSGKTTSRILANFLYECSCMDPLAFGVYLFWLLQVETFGVFHPESAYSALQARLLNSDKPWDSTKLLKIAHKDVVARSCSKNKAKGSSMRKCFAFEDCKTFGDLIQGQLDLWGGNGLIAQIVRMIHRAQHKGADPYELLFDSEKRRIGGFLTINIVTHKNAKSRTRRISPIVTDWSRKWTVLFDRGIQYFNSDKDQQAKGYIPLTASSRITECTSIDGESLQFCFKISVAQDGFKACDGQRDDEYTFYGLCENQSQYLMWTSQLSHAIVDLQNNARDDAENISNFDAETRRKFRCVFPEGVYFHSSPVGVVIVEMKLEYGDTIFGSVSSIHPNWIEVAHNLWLPVIYELQVQFTTSSHKSTKTAVARKQKQQQNAHQHRQVMLQDITHTLDGNCVSLLFKIGDDLRQDMLVLRLFEMFDGFWQAHDLNLPLPRNRVVSTWRDGGVVEIIPQSATLADIQTKFGGGVFGSFAKNPITQYLQMHNKTPKDFSASLDLFTRSLAGACVSSCVLGFGDRHNDNIMVTESGFLFHIDFGHFLGHTMLSPTGQRRELTRFVLTQAMVHTVQQQGEDGMDRLIEYCVKAYLVLRSKADVILQYLNMMLPSHLPEMRDVGSVEYIREMLHLEMDQAAAGQWFVDTVQSCFSDGVEFAKSFDDSMHILGQSSRKSVTKKLTNILQSSLMKRLPRKPIVTPYGGVLGPIVYERCFVSGSNARPVILTFEKLPSQTEKKTVQSISDFGRAVKDSDLTNRADEKEGTSRGQSTRSCAKKADILRSQQMKEVATDTRTSVYIYSP